MLSRADLHAEVREVFGIGLELLGHTSVAKPQKVRAVHVELVEANVGWQERLASIFGRSDPRAQRNQQAGLKLAVEQPRLSKTISPLPSHVVR